MSHKRCNSNSRHTRRFRVPAAGALLLSAVLIGALSGCRDTTAKEDDSAKGADLPAESAFVPAVEVTPVKGEDFIEYIELPGASVRGMESTPLYSKVGGFVKTIRRIGYVTYQGKQVQITDAFDRQTGRAQDIEFRLIDPETGKTEAAHTFPDVELANLKQPELTSLYRDLVRNQSMLQIDIGAHVQVGTLLAALDIPEMEDDLKKQLAAIDSARSAVEQKDAAIRSAQAQVALKNAEWEAAKKARDEVLAKVQKDEKELVRIKRLGRNVEGAILEETEFKVAASKAALATADENIKSARQGIESAQAAVDQAEADKKLALALVREEEAELSRLRTIAGYAQIQAPFSGTITRRFVDHGAFVRPAKENSGAGPLFAITQTDVVRVIIPVPGRKAYKVRPGQRVWFHSIGGLPSVVIAGTITRSAGTLDPASRMLRVEMYLKNPAVDQRLIRKGRQWVPRALSSDEKKKKPTVDVLPGMFGTITVKKQWHDLRKVPATALGADGDQHYVMEVTAGENGTRRVIKRYVTVVYNDAQSVGITGGLAVGAKIVTANVAGLKDGQKVALKSP